MITDLVLIKQDSKFVAGSLDNIITIYIMTDYSIEMESTFENNFGGIYSMILAINLPVDVLLIGGRDGKLRLYDYKSNSIASTHEGYKSPIVDLSIVYGNED